MEDEDEDFDKDDKVIIPILSGQASVFSERYESQTLTPQKKRNMSGLPRLHLRYKPERSICPCVCVFPC